METIPSPNPLPKPIPKTEPKPKLASKAKAEPKSKLEPKSKSELKSKSDSKLEPKLNLFWPSVIVSAVFVLSLVPLIWIALYDHPSTGDFIYGLEASKAIAKSGSLFSVFPAAAQSVHTAFAGGQGNFAAVFFMSLTPSAVSEQAYWITPLLAIAGFLLANLLLFKQVLMNTLKANLWAYFLFSAVSIGMSLNFLPSPAQGLYWYSGTVLYTGCYSLFLIVVSLVLLFYRAKKLPMKILCGVIVVVASVLLGGGNGSTALLTIVVLAALAVLGFLKRTIRAVLPAVSVFLATEALLFSVFATMQTPIHHGALIEFSALPGAFLNSLKAALVYPYQWTTPQVVLAALFLILPISSIVRTSKFSFRLPLLVPAASFVVLFLQFLPSYYTWGTVEAPGLLNIVYFSYVLLVLVNLFYFTGWLFRQFAKPESKDAEQTVFQRWVSLSQKYVFPVLIVFGVLFSLSCVGSNNVRKITSASAVISILDGEAAQYHSELSQRRTVYQKSQQKDVTVKPLSAKPYVLYVGDLQADPNASENVAVSKYYDLKSVTQKP